MKTRFHVGAQALKGGLSAYGKRFGMVEVAVPSAAQLKQFPSETALKRWKKEVSPTFEFVVVLGPATATLVPGADADAELEAALTAVRVLQARMILLRTPPSVTPSAVMRKRMAALLARLPTDATAVAWEPRGVWDEEAAARAAKAWGLVLVVDASRDAVPAGPVAYVRLRALGERRSFGAAALERVVEAIGERREAYVVIETDGALAEKKLLMSAAARGVALPLGGQVLRPRGRPAAAEHDEDEE